MKKIAIIFILILSSFLTSGYKRPDFYTIDSVKNARIHNNKGIYYLEEHLYYPAIEEFKIAISLNPNTQATAVYYNNLGETYMKLNRPDLALDCFEKALVQYSLNLKYYQNLADCYIALNMTDQKFQETAEKTNPLNMIMRGLLYEKTGDVRKAITILDEFTYTEPDLLITPSIRLHIKKLVKEHL
ncbi:tetratricopeptide repeat protein [bacterium]|nr:tetratricopeptide repeat protein [bacterium]